MLAQLGRRPVLRTNLLDPLTDPRRQTAAGLSAIEDACKYPLFVVVDHLVARRLVSVGQLQRGLDRLLLLFVGRLRRHFRCARLVLQHGLRDAVHVLAHAREFGTRALADLGGGIGDRAGRVGHHHPGLCRRCTDNLHGAGEARAQTGDPA